MGFYRGSSGAGLCLILIIVQITISSGFPLGKRLYRSLPSVSDNHYSEVSPDGTYKYAYTGQDSYTAERRLPDGTVEGETYLVRADGIPVKVHYFADANGYRPKTEVLYAERHVKGIQSAPKQKVIVPQLVYKEVEVEKQNTVPEPSVLLAPPKGGYNYEDDAFNRNSQISSNPTNLYATPTNLYGTPNNLNSNQGNFNSNPNNLYRPPSNFNSSPNSFNSSPKNFNRPPTPTPVETSDENDTPGDGDNTAVAAPSVTAILGPAGVAEIIPEAVAKTGSSKRLRSKTGRRRGGGNNKAIAQPNVIAIIGPGGQVTISPRGIALADSDDDYSGTGNGSPQRTIPRPTDTDVHSERRQGSKKDGPRAIYDEIRGHDSLVTPEIAALKAQGAILIAPKASYSYEYAYSSPDVKYPSYGLNRAYVNVKVNQ